MAKLGISTGTTPNDGTGDSLLVGAGKINDNFDEVYGKLGDGTTLFVGIVSSLSVSGPLSISTSYGAPVITGLANTANINATNFQVTGVGTITGTTKLAGISTFSDAGYTVAGLVTCSNLIVNETVKVAGVVTTSEDGINVGAGVTSRTFAIQDVTALNHYVGLNTVFLDKTGVAATAINVTNTATIAFASVTNANLATFNAGTANIHSGILTTATVGAAVTIHSAGIDAGQAGILTASRLYGAVTGAVTGTASSATRADLSYGLLGTPNITVGVSTLGSHIFNAPGAYIAGIITANAYYVGANEVVSSARQLKNIATLDATTKTTIETAVKGAPNDFDDLNVVGLATVNRLWVSGDILGANLLGITTGISAPGVTTLGIVTGATSLQATDVYTNFLHGDASAVTGSPSFTRLTATKGLIGAGVTIDQSNIDAGHVTGIVTASSFVGNLTGNLTGTPTLGTGVTVTAHGLEVVSGIVTAVTFTGNLTGTVNTAAQTNITSLGTLSAVTVSGNITANGNIVGDNSTDITGISSVIATKLYGDGTNITDVTSTVAGINTTGTSGFSQLNVTGVSTFASTINIGVGASISGDLSRAYRGRWVLGADGTNHYTFTGIGFTETKNDPDLYLARGSTYEFRNESGSHPFRIQSTQNGSTGSAYNGGVTNNDGGNDSSIIFEVPFEAPDTLYYQCTSHTGMGGTIFIYPTLR